MAYATTDINKYLGDETFTNPLTHTGTGTVSYASSNTAVATVDASTGVVTLGNTTGWTLITATAAASNNYQYASNTAAYTLSVTGKTDANKPRIIVWLTDGNLTTVTFDSEPEFVCDESTNRLNITGTALS